MTTRLNSLVKALQLTDIQQYAPIGMMCDFATLAATYQKVHFVSLLTYVTDFKLGLRYHY
jgi:hypothetical protein